MTEPAHPIWAILKEQGRQFKWLAEKSGYSRQHVYNIRYGIWPSSPRFRAACARALNLPESVLFSEAADEVARERMRQRVRRRQPVAVA